MSIFSRIKNKFRDLLSGGRKKKRRDEPTPSQGGGTSRGGGSYSEGVVSERRRLINNVKAQKKQQDKTTKSLASINSNINKKLAVESIDPKKANKVTPPKAKVTTKPKVNLDPKQELVREAHDRHKKKFEEVKKKHDAERASYHKATGNKYNPNVGTKEQRAEARRRIKSGEYQSDPEAAKWEYIHHPKRSSFARGAVSGATFGGSEILAKVAPMSKSAREAEETYQKHKSRGWEIAGEVAGSIPSFMMTGGASASLVGGAAKKVAPKLFEKGSEAAVRKVASSAIVRKGAEKAAERAVEQGLIKSATKEAVERIARERAERLVAGAGKDFAINATTGALMDASYAARDSKNLGEFGKNFATNQALSYGLGGALTIAPELRVGRGVLGMKGGLRDEIANDLIRDTAARDKLRRATMSAGELRNVEPPRVSVPRLGNVDNAVEDAARSAVDNAVTPARGAIAEADNAVEAVARGARGTADEATEAVAKQEVARQVLGDVPEPAENAVREVAREVEPPKPKMATKATTKASAKTTAKATAETAKAEPAEQGIKQLKKDVKALREEKRSIKESLESKYSSLKPDTTQMTDAEREAFESQSSRLKEIETELRSKNKAIKEATPPKPKAETKVKAEVETKQPSLLDTEINPAKSAEPATETATETATEAVSKNATEADTATIRKEREKLMRERRKLKKSLDAENPDAKTVKRIEKLDKQIKEKGDQLGIGMPKTKEKPKPQPKATQNVDDFAGVSDDIPMNSAKAQTKLTDEVDKAVNKTAKDYHATSNKFLDEMAEARKAEGVDFPENKNFKQMSVNQAEEVRERDFRDNDWHTKRGVSNIATGIGDEGFQGDVLKMIQDGGVTMKVWHDKTSYADGARRINEQCSTKEGIGELIGKFKKYAKGGERLNTQEQREMLFDALAAIDYANANKDLGEKWVKDLYLSAIDAAGEQASVGGLTLRQFQKIAMANPSHRAEVVKHQIEAMFSKSRGFNKVYGKIGADNIHGFKTLDDFIKANPEFKEAMDALSKMGEATTLGDVEKAAEKCLLEARKVIPATVLDTVTQWRYVAMLSSPKTHVRNFVGNAYSATIGQFKTALASTVEDSVFKNNKELLKQVQAGKINKDEMFKSATGLSWAANKDSRIGILTGIKLDGAKSRLAKAEEALSKIKATDETALKAAKKRVDDLSSEVSRLEKQLAEKKPTRLSAAKAQESWHSTSKEKLITNVQKFEQKFSHNAKGRISKGVNKMSDVVGLALETSDAASVERIYREAYDKCLMANGWERLAEQAKGAGKEAKAAQARMKRIEEFAEEIASYKAAQDTYRNYNAVSNWMNKVVNDTLFNYNAPIYKKAGGFLLHAVMPFTKVPTNIVKRGLDYSPVGLIEGKKMLSEAIKHGDVVAINKACERLSEGLVGTGILALGAGLGALDPDGFNITTRLSSNDFVDKQKRDRGYQDYSATINNVNFTLDWATPTSATLFTGVEFGQMFRKVADTVSGKSGLELNVSELVNFPMEMVSSLVEPTLQLTMFQGINKTLEDVIKSDNYSSTNVNPAIKIVSEIFSNYVTSMIPAALGGISRAFAPYDYFVTGDSDLTYMLNSTAAKIPFLSNQMFGAKTNVWGQIKNERVTTGDKVGSVAKNLFSPANINKVTWDETDDWALNYYKDTGWEGIFPKNNYDKEVHVGRIKGEHDIKMSNKELAEYNVQRGKSGSDAMNDALDTPIFHRWYKDGKGRYTIEGEDNITEAERDKLVKQFKGKGIKDVVDWVRETPQFKNATPKEQQKVISTIYGDGGLFGGDDDEAKGAKRYAERYIAGKKGMKASEYDFYNETPKTIQENLQPAIDSGLITYEEAVDFTRNAGKTYYRTDQSGETGGSVTTRYNKKEMLAYLESKGYSEEKAATLFNAYKQSNAKEYGASSYRRGYRRRGGYRRWHRHGHGGGSGRVGVNKTAPKVRGLKGGVALTAKSASKSAADIAKKQPKLERVKAKVTLPDAKW